MTNLKRYCLALDLVDDHDLIKEYEAIHQNIWPEVRQHILDTGIIDMQIWRIGNRLFMIMDVNEQFSFSKSSAMEVCNPIIAEWEKQMWRYQLPTPWTPPEQKWVLMKEIFNLTNQL